MYPRISSRALLGPREKQLDDLDLEFEVRAFIETALAETVPNPATIGHYGASSAFPNTTGSI